MIIVKQFVSGASGQQKTLGVVPGPVNKHNVFTSVYRMGCVSCLWERQTVYTYKCGKVEYVVDPLGDGDFELSLASDDLLPLDLKDYCDACGRAK